MIKRLVILLILVFVPVSSSFAMSGRGYMQYCSPVDVSSTNFLRCGAYVIGVVDNMRANKTGDVGYQNVCFPDKLNETQMVEMTLKWLQKNPDSWNTWAAFAVTMAMFENYKCGCDDDKEPAKK